MTQTPIPITHKFPRLLELFHESLAELPHAIDLLGTGREGGGAEVPGSLDLSEAAALDDTDSDCVEHSEAVGFLNEWNSPR